MSMAIVNVVILAPSCQQGIMTHRGIDSSLQTFFPPILAVTTKLIVNNEGDYHGIRCPPPDVAILAPSLLMSLPYAICVEPFVYRPCIPWKQWVYHHDSG